MYPDSSLHTSSSLSNEGKEYKLSRTKKKKNDSKKQRMFTDIDNCASLIKFFLVTFSTNELVFRPTPRPRGYA